MGKTMLHGFFVFGIVTDQNELFKTAEEKNALVWKGLDLKEVL